MIFIPLTLIILPLLGGLIAGFVLGVIYQKKI